MIVEHRQKNSKFRNISLLGNSKKLNKSYEADCVVEWCFEATKNHLKSVLQTAKFR